MGNYANYTENGPILVKGECNHEIDQRGNEACEEQDLLSA
jgi:hypothetical protein